MRPERTRRDFLRLAAGGAAGLLLAACGARDEQPEAAAAPPAEVVRTPPQPLPPRPAPLPRAVPPAGQSERMLLPGTQWETAAVLNHSGRAGPGVLVLGGVHGNEPGGWLAAEQIATWTPRTGSLLVVPRANVLATQVLERTLPELGDLNRLYPGSPLGALPMERMAAAIVSLAREFRVGLVLDLHESWAFYAERTQDGTAFLGQTITSGPGPAGSEASRIAQAVNAQLEVRRDRLIPRDSRSFTATAARPQQSAEDVAAGAQSAQPSGRWQPGRGGSSLSIGRYVRGLTPVLVEMGQQGQTVERRAELHRLTVRAALEMQGMF